MKKTLLASLSLFLILFTVMRWIEFSTPDLPDNDGFYHIKMAYLMRTEGLKPAFPYLPLTILNAKEFYDHHFLFHVALIPFTFGDLRLGAKYSAVLFSALAFLAVWWLLKRQRVPYHWIWGLAILAISAPFLYRMSVTRAQSLSLGVLALAMILMLEGRHKSLAVLAFVYVWMYDAFPLLLAFGVLHLLAVAVIERRLDFRPLLFITLGVAAGVLINPYFPNNIIFTYHHLLPKLTDATSTSVGNEWYPYTTLNILNNSLPSLVVFATGIFGLGLSGRKMDVRTAFSLLVTLMFTYMLFQARRFVEYFPPFALIFAAFALAPLLDREAAPASPIGSSPILYLLRLLRSNLLAIALIIAVLAGMFVIVPMAREDILDSAPYQNFEGSSAWLARNTPPGTRVFQTDWDDFPRLFFYNTHNTYIVGLDPTYMQIYDPALYETWVNITNGDATPISYLVATQFGAHYIVSDLHHGSFLAEARHDSGLVEVYRDEYSVVFKVISP